MIVLLWIQITLENKHKKKQQEMQPEQRTVSHLPPLRLRLRLRLRPRPRPRPRPRLPPHAIVVKCSSISVLLFNPIYTFVQKNIHTLRPQRKHHKNYFVWILFFIRNIVLLLSIFITRKYQQQKQSIPKIIPTTYNYKCTYTYAWPDTNIQKKNHTRVDIQNVYTDTNTMCTKTKNLYSWLRTNVLFYF